MYYCTNSRLGMIPRIPVASSFLGQHSQPVYCIIPSGHQSRHWKKMIFQCKSPLIGDFQLLCLIISWLSHVIPIFYIVIHELSFLRSNPMPLKNTPSTALVEASNLAALNGSSVVVLGSKVCWNMDEIGFIPWYPMENGDLRILRGIWVGIYGDILWCN